VFAAGPLSALASSVEKSFRLKARFYWWISAEEILERLLALNLERAAEETRAAKTSAKKRSSRSKSADEMI
jgi:hypothetical protein